MDSYLERAMDRISSGNIYDSSGKQVTGAVLFSNMKQLMSDGYTEIPFKVVDHEWYSPRKELPVLPPPIGFPKMSSVFNEEHLPRYHRTPYVEPEGMPRNDYWAREIRSLDAGPNPYLDHARQPTSMDPSSLFPGATPVSSIRPFCRF